MKITAISGSLREGSHNTALLRAFAALAPDDVEFTLFQSLGELPIFSPDLEGGTPHSAVKSWRDALEIADAAIISTPEYAHCIPGGLKNALDWAVGSGEFSQKPVAAISASPSQGGGSHAHASLVETLTTMDARVVPGASLSIGYIQTKLGINGAGISPELQRLLMNCLVELRKAVEQA